MQQAVAQLKSVAAAVILQQLNTILAQATIANFCKTPLQHWILEFIQQPVGQIILMKFCNYLNTFRGTFVLEGATGENSSYKASVQKRLLIWL
ncbi:hypothetical protein VCHA50O407_20224 [Vibrio chagasii]|nr:hypothetical protein VCHA50O407_20224 [Vibrio chagasii]CAH7245157.1 hypothetical protein VCHA40P240_30277 [Vibrio chagasii]CAH7300846.1 hypothetical protein VCHA50P424_30365 [Vibrio chagasii]